MEKHRGHYIYALDLTPDVTDVPAETWSGMNIDRVADELVSNSIFTEEDLLLRAKASRPVGLLELIRNQKPYAGPTESEREMLKDSPELLRILEDTAREDQLEFERAHGYRYQFE